MLKKFPFPSRLCLGMFLSTLLLGSPTFAKETDCDEVRSRLASKGTLNIRIDNDLFGGFGQDQGYTNGFLITWVTPNLIDYPDNPCFAGRGRQLRSYLAWLSPKNFNEQNMTFGLGQLLFTPKDRERTDLITNDRPYAAALLYGWGYNASNGEQLQTSQIRLGVVGPAALGRQVQTKWHDLIGAKRFRGWDNQLHNEPVVQLIHERRYRWFRRDKTLGWDAIGHWGSSLGNFATYVNVGTEWRLGLHLPNDLGTAPLRPGGENTTPVRTSAHSSWNTHLFVALDARWMVHDITLDGNSFRSSPRVDKRPFVADLGYGVAITLGTWRLAFARYHRTREFNGQHTVPVYGTITLGKHF
jgi:hypothetical protein